MSDTVRYISFNPIAKKCPKGTWLDKQTGKCIPIDEWKSKYGGKRERTDEKDKKKRCPKGKWRDPATGECISQEEWRERNQKRPKKESVKDDFKPRDEITPDTTGIEKAPILALTKGYVKERINKSFGKINEQAVITSDELRQIERPEDFERKVGRAFAGTETDVDERLKYMDPAGRVMVANDMADVISEFPMGIDNLEGIKFTDEDDRSALMFYKPSDRTISFCGGYFKEGGSSTANVNTESHYDKAYDPVLKKVTDKWSFHPEGSKVAQSFSHEYGHHLVQTLVLAQSNVKRYYKEHPDEIPESYRKKKEEHEKKIEEFKKELTGLLEELGTSEDDAMIRISSYSGDVDFFINYKSSEMEIDEDDFDAYIVTSSNEKYRKVMKFMEKHGFKREKKKIDAKFTGWDSKEENYTLSMEFKDPHKNFVFDEPLPTPPLDKLIDFVGTNGDVDNLFKGDYDIDIKWEFAGKIVEECEDLYKELYGVKEIIPSDVYTGYAYFGPLQSFSQNDHYYEYKGKRKKGSRYGDKKGDAIYEKKKKYPIDAKDKSWRIRDGVAGERIAEAISDCTIRKDKANSMSVLIASAIQYEFYKIATGTSESFSDFIRANVDKKKLGKPIIKSKDLRYIVFG